MGVGQVDCYPEDWKYHDSDLGGNFGPDVCIALFSPEIIAEYDCCITHRIDVGAHRAVHHG